MLVLSLPAILVAEEAPQKTKEETVKPAEPVVREASVKIDGKDVPYRVTSGKIQLKRDDGKPEASIFHVSYERSDIDDKRSRPVMFAFNGGPGSSAVWLHIGVLGPRIIRLPGDGTAPPKPPVTVEDNPFSILDACDLVFVDPVSTGYSRTDNEVKPDDFHGVDEDLESVKIMRAHDIEQLGGKLFPRVWTMRKTGEQDRFTRLEYHELQFLDTLPDSLFSLANLKNPRR